MQYRAALAVAALAPLAAANSITITSSCSFPVYLWNVVENYGSGAPTRTLSAGDSWTGDFTSRTDNGGGGPCIKLKKNNNIFDGGEIAQVEYKMDPNMNTLFYDLSLINGNPLVQDGTTMSVPSRPDCPVIDCQPGVNPCPDAYFHPDDPQTKACNNGGGNIQVHLCGSGGGSSSSSSGSSPKPSPPKPTTLAKQKPSVKPEVQGGNFLQEGKDGAVVVTATTVVAVTSYVHIPARTAEAEAKREEHMNLHMRHGHSRVMGRHAH